jgi:hypothetical protein
MAPIKWNFPGGEKTAMSVPKVREYVDAAIKELTEFGMNKTIPGEWSDTEKEVIGEESAQADLALVWLEAYDNG